MSITKNEATFFLCRLSSAAKRRDYIRTTVEPGLTE